VVVVVVDPVGVDGCCGRVVVVVDVDDVDRGLVATVVVATCPRRCERVVAYLRRAEATGTEMASTTVTAVITTTNVRSLRLILYPFFDGWEARDGARTALGIARGRAPGAPCVAAARCRRSSPGLEPPSGWGPNVLDHGQTVRMQCSGDFRLN
jgi:hypothetical protein